MANYYSKRQRARGRAETCPCEKTIRARGEVYLSLGAYDIQMSCPLLTLNRMEYCFRGVGGLHRPLWRLSLIPLTTCPCGIHGDIGVCRGPQAL